MRLPTFALRAAARVPRGRPGLVHARLSLYSFVHSYRGLSTSAVRPSADVGGRKWSTPLAEKLAAAIDATEPMPLARYMRMCLTSDVGGYYTRGDLKEGEDQFGVKGDFVTSPEISQIFGELIGIWFTVEWLCQGRQSSGVELIEVGPGRGTLMDDILRTIKKSPIATAVDTIYMVEASARLREAQKNLLCGPDARLTESKMGWHSICKHTGRPIIWTETIQSVPKPAAKMPFILAHEFFDALPIHAFQRVQVPPSKSADSTSSTESTPAATDTSKPNLEWREMVVTPTPTQPTLDPSNPAPEFQLSLSEAPTSHTQYLAHSSPRMHEFENTPNAIVEVCPDAALYADEFATRIGGSEKHPKLKPSGAALILDYGSDEAPVNSLRGIRRHRRVSPFAEPGLVDLSADVDFTAIARAATRASEGVEIHGIVPQAQFLQQMGGKERAEMLMKAGGAERAKAIHAAFERLVDQGEGGMGRLYKALAILPENGGKRRPVGFGGDVQ